MQLAYVRDGESYVVVASAMGQERHPAWRYNLEAAGGGGIRLRGQLVDVAAVVLTAEDKRAIWPEIKRTIPQMSTYEERTDRDITVFRLTPSRTPQ